MSTGKSTRRNKGADPPVLPLTTSQSQLSRLPVSTLQLYLNQFHLAQDGNKAAKVQRLYAHLQSLQGTTQTVRYSDSMPTFSLSKVLLRLSVDAAASLTAATTALLVIAAASQIMTVPSVKAPYK